MLKGDSDGKEKSEDIFTRVTDYLKINLQHPRSST